MSNDKKDDGKPKDPNAAALGARGGKARAENLTPEQLAEIGKKGALVRWAHRPIRAIHKGNFKEEFGIDVDCYVLEDEQKTAVVSRRGMAAALGFVGGGASGHALPRFLDGAKVARHVGAELREKLQNPLKFQWGKLGSNQPVPVIHGYNVTLLIDVCKAIIDADEDGEGLLKRQAHIAKQARIIVNASAKAGIKNLVYALAGYDATKEETIAAFKFYVREEAREYEKEFPEQLYKEWYRLYQLPEPPRNRPWKFKQLTVDQVYKPLARSNGKVLALTRARKAQSGERWTKLHQFLSEIGVKVLRTHLGILLGIAQVSENVEQYERNFEKVFPGQQIKFDFGEPS